MSHKVKYILAQMKMNDKEKILKIQIYDVTISPAALTKAVKWHPDTRPNHIIDNDILHNYRTEEQLKMQHIKTAI
jgi:hypothetical protein